MSMEGKFYAVRTTVGQEKNIALILEAKVRSRRLPVKSILVLDNVRGFLFIECDAPFYVDMLISKTKYVKGRIGGVLTYDDLEKFIMPKPVIEEIELNDIVEIISGPFRGMQGRVIQIERGRGEIKVEILEAAYPLPITINAEYVRIIRKGSESKS